MRDFERTFFHIVKGHLMVEQIEVVDTSAEVSPSGCKTNLN